MFTMDVKQQYNNNVISSSLIKLRTLCIKYSYNDLIDNPFRVVLGWAYRGLTGGFLLLQNFSVAISVSPHVCSILVLILISMHL